MTKTLKDTPMTTRISKAAKNTTPLTNVSFFHYNLKREATIEPILVSIKNYKLKDEKAFVPPTLVSLKTYKIRRYL